MSEVPQAATGGVMGTAVKEDASNDWRDSEERPAAADEFLLSLDNVSIAYEDAATPAVQDVSLRIRRGESVLFLGPSGCGKSTVAMLAAGLIPRSVEAVVTGEVWRAGALAEAGQVGYVFQDPDSQFCMLTVADEIAFGLENQRVPRDVMPDRIATSLTRAGLDVPLSAAHAQFSGGMKQKLAIACALALEPALLVLDEPTANLDPASSRQVFDQIAKLREAGQTMLVIEHKFDALLSTMDTVVLFDREGRIHRLGSTLTVIEEEWDWLVAEGVVAPWKQSPLARSSQRDADARPVGGHRQTEHDIAEREVEQRAAFCLRAAALRFGEKVVWQDVSVSIAEGAFVAVVGPNGSGKSSLLQVLAGLQKPSAGELEFLGRESRSWRPRERYRALAYCFQNPELQFIYERVGDELANRVVGADVPAEIRALLDQFGLADTVSQSPFGLSQGQKRRLSVAAMVRDAHQVYVLDEPTFGQDARTQMAIMNRLEALHQAGQTIVMTTHDMDLVRRYASDVVVLADGGVQFVGPPDELFAREDILRLAHLNDDLRLSEQKGVLDSASANGDAGNAAAQHTRTALSPVASDTSLTKRRRGPISVLHPGWLFVGMFCASMIALFAQTLPQAVAVFVSSLIVLMGLGWMGPWRIAKLLWPFALLYVLYLWSFIANAAVPPGTRTFNILWYHISWHGLYPGLVLSARMLGSVMLAILFLTNIDITDLVVSLCKDLRVPPKFAYGTMAGLRMVPLFREEWTKLRQARQLRGKDAGMSWLRPITFAMPLLGQAIRMSERVTIAMEARGLTGAAMQSARARSFLRTVAPHWWDYAANAGVCLLILISVIVF